MYVGERGYATMKAKDVAAYILEKKGSLTGFQLQKLLYYCQAWNLVFVGDPLFEDQIEAWEHGPVVPSVSRLHQHAYWVNRRHIADADSRNIPLADQCLIDAVLDSYGDLSGDQLEQLTHSEAPWRDAFNGSTYYQSQVIAPETMREYYAALSASDAAARSEHIVPRFSCPRHVYVSDDDFDWLMQDDE